MPDEELLVESVNSTELSETADAGQETGSTDTPEPAVETDEQKAERERVDSERAAARADRKQKALDNRFAELTAEKHALKAQADQLARQLEEARQPKLTPVSGEPTRDQFDDYEAYIVARAEYRAEQRALAIAERSAKSFQEVQAQQAREQSAKAETTAYLERQKEAAKTIPDFNDVMEDADVEVPTTVFNMIKRMADGPTIAYHMAKNPALAKQFYDNPPDLHGVLLGQLSASLKVPAKTVSSAPPPGKTVSSTRGSSMEPPSDPNLYRTWADKHLRK